MISGPIHLGFIRYSSHEKASAMANRCDFLTDGLCSFVNVLVGSKCRDKSPYVAFRDHSLLHIRLSLAYNHGKQVDISQALDMYLHVSV